MTNPRYTLHRGDCIEVMRTLPSGGIDSCVTDPPYGMAFQSNRSKTGPRHAKIAQDSTVDPAWLVETYRLLKTGGGLLMFCNWATSHEWREHILAAGFSLNSQIIWDREHHGMGDLRGGFAPMHDIVWYATKGRRIFVNGRPKSVFRAKRPSPTEDHGHPTCKPVPLMAALVRAIEDAHGGVVLDPFMGSGSTGTAAVSLGRPFVGIELDPTYFSTARTRIEAAFAEAGGDLL